MRVRNTYYVGLPACRNQLCWATMHVVTLLHLRTGIDPNARALYHRKPIKRRAHTNICLNNYNVASEAMVRLAVVIWRFKIAFVYINGDMFICAMSIFDMHTANSENVVGDRLQAYATRPKRIMGKYQCFYKYTSKKKRLSRNMNHFTNRIWLSMFYTKMMHL